VFHPCIKGVCAQVPIFCNVKSVHFIFINSNFVCALSRHDQSFTLYLHYSVIYRGSSSRLELHSWMEGEKKTKLTTLNLDPTVHM
jgi:hypothetical protein